MAGFVSPFAGLDGIINQHFMRGKITALFPANIDLPVSVLQVLPTYLAEYAFRLVMGRDLGFCR
jgi:hypothetical protein